MRFRYLSQHLKRVLFYPVIKEEVTRGFFYIYIRLQFPLDYIINISCQGFTE